MIGEIINATFKGKDLVKFTISGEISLGFVSASNNIPFNFRLNDTSKLEKIIPNPTFIKTSSSGIYQYTPNTSNVNNSRTQVVLKYQISPQYRPVPIRIISLLKSQPQFTDFGLQYEINPSLAHSLRELSFFNIYWGY